MERSYSSVMCLSSHFNYGRNKDKYRTIKKSQIKLKSNLDSIIIKNKCINQ